MASKLRNGILIHSMYDNNIPPAISNHEIAERCSIKSEHAFDDLEGRYKGKKFVRVKIEPEEGIELPNRNA